MQSISLAWPLAAELPVFFIKQGQSLWWLQLLAMAVFAHALLSASTVKQAAWRSWVFSTAWLCGSIWWLYISMHTYGGLPSWLAALAVLLLGGALALFYMLVCMLFKRITHINNASVASIFAACWMLAELARGTWLTGFPWGAVGYAHVDGPLASFAPYVGVYGISFAAAFVAMGLAQWLRAKQRGASQPSSQSSKYSTVQGVNALLLLLAAWLLSWPVKPDNTVVSALQAPLDVTLLQGNIPQNEKFQSGTGVATALTWYAEQLAAVKTGLVVTPETAIPLLPQHLEPDYWAKLQQPFTAQNNQKAALIGLPMGNRADGYSNSVLGIQPVGIENKAPTAINFIAPPQLYQYSKNHLVPFGEFIPPFAQWFINMMDIPLGTFNRGGLGQPTFNWQGQRLGINICYEDLFGEELAHGFANAATAPTMLVNVSNIAWFGNTVAIDQHQNIARMRSMELARSSIRATNTGATVIINAQGKVTHALQRHTRGVLLGEVYGSNVITPYAWWVSRFWLWPLWVLGLLVIALGYMRSSGRALGRFRQ